MYLRTRKKENKRILYVNGATWLPGIRKLRKGAIELLSGAIFSAIYPHANNDGY